MFLIRGSATQIRTKTPGVASKGRRKETLGKEKGKEGGDPNT